jgi:hypothetical protein
MLSFSADMKVVQAVFSLQSLLDVYHCNETRGSELRLSDDSDLSKAAGGCHD